MAAQALIPTTVMPAFVASAIGSGIGSLLQGGSTEDALQAGFLGGIGGAIGGQLGGAGSDAVKMAGADSAVKGAVPPSVIGGGQGSGEFLRTDGSGALSFGGVQGVPAGSVFCMAVATVPSGYLECNGAAVSRTTYSALFAIIGTQYGTGNGSSTFNLPDLRGEFVRGFDNGRGVDNGRSIASGQGAQNSSHNHTASSSVTDPGHRHLPENYTANSNQSNGHTIAVNDRVIGNYGGGSGNGLGPLGNRHFMETETTGISVTTTVALDGGNDGQGSRPRNVAMMYVIKT